MELDPETDAHNKGCCDTKKLNGSYATRIDTADTDGYAVTCWAATSPHLTTLVCASHTVDAPLVKIDARYLIGLTHLTPVSTKVKVR